jgi:hypothetical protein
MRARRTISMLSWKIFLAFLLAGGSATASRTGTLPQPPSNQKNTAQSPDRATADDISGMYTFLDEGEFVQINREEDGVTGYISRMGDRESDRGSFLDQFFSKAAIQGHEVSFTTKILHGTWFEFKGRYERGPGRTKSEDGYFVLRGTLTEFAGTDDKKSTIVRTRKVDFKWLAQPDDEEPQKPPKRK